MKPFCYDNAHNPKHLEKTAMPELSHNLPEIDLDQAELQLALPLVAVIGRPNVGKSTFINRLVGSRQAIVDDMPGVTRDRTYHTVDWVGRCFRVVDTGGLVTAGMEDPFGQLINEQIDLAVNEADVILMLVDGQSGLNPDDETLAHRLRQLKKPVFLVVNKIDSLDQQGLAAEFYKLGLGEPFHVSAMHARTGDLLDALVARLPEKTEASLEPFDENTIKVALIGRPNVGKSSILNRLLGQTRSIVSDIAGTTRDSIDAQVVVGEQTYVFVDTAGLRRKAKVDYGVEMFSADRAIRSIKDANVCVLVVDAVDGITDQDNRIISTVLESGRALVIVLNKWDLVPDKDTNTAAKQIKALRLSHHHIHFVPIITTSALTGQRVTKLFEPVLLAARNGQRRISTSVLNQVLMDATTLVEPPVVKNRRLKVLYGTQVSVAPPTFVIFVNDPKLLTQAYQRYLEKKLREAIDFEGTPILLLPRERTSTPRKPRRRPEPEPTEDDGGTKPETSRIKPPSRSRRKPR
jgi:GTPase